MCKQPTTWNPETGICDDSGDGGVMAGMSLVRLWLCASAPSGRVWCPTHSSWSSSQHEALLRCPGPQHPARALWNSVCWKSKIPFHELARLGKQIGEGCQRQPGDSSGRCLCVDGGDLVEIGGPSRVPTGHLWGVSTLVIQYALSLSAATVHASSPLLSGDWGAVSTPSGHRGTRAPNLLTLWREGQSQAPAQQSPRCWRPVSFLNHVVTSESVAVTWGPLWAPSAGHELDRSSLDGGVL